MIVLNVGGGENRSLPPFFKKWEQHVLDIDASVNPEIVCDARKMSTIKRKYDAIYCSHNLEHFHKHELPQVLNGFNHVLKADGFAHIVVPDLQQLFDCIVKGNKDIDDVWYTASAPITFHDVLYGWNFMLAQGNQYYAHKCGFTDASITKTLKRYFKHVYTASDEYGNLHACAFKAKPTKEQLKCL